MPQGDVTAVLPAPADGGLRVTSGSTLESGGAALGHDYVGAGGRRLDVRRHHHLQDTDLPGQLLIYSYVTRRDSHRICTTWPLQTGDNFSTQPEPIGKLHRLYRCDPVPDSFNGYPIIQFSFMYLFILYSFRLFQFIQILPDSFNVSRY